MAIIDKIVKKTATEPEWIDIGAAAGNVTYDNTTSQLAATDVKAAIDEVNGKINTADAKTASDIYYVKPSEGVEGKTVKAKIDEVDGKKAGDISYTNTSSGLSAETIQAAIDEVNGKTGDIKKIEIKSSTEWEELTPEAGTIYFIKSEDPVEKTGCVKISDIYIGTVVDTE